MPGISRAHRNAIVYCHCDAIAIGVFVCLEWLCSRCISNAQGEFDLVEDCIASVHDLCPLNNRIPVRFICPSSLAPLSDLGLACIALASIGFVKGYRRQGPSPSHKDIRHTWRTNHRLPHQGLSQTCLHETLHTLSREDSCSWKRTG